MVRDKHLPAVVVYSGWQDLPSNARAFSLTSFATQSSSCDYIRVSGRFIYSIKCLQAFPSFLPLPALLLAPFFRMVGLCLFAPEPHRNACYAGQKQLKASYC